MVDLKDLTPEEANRLLRAAAMALRADHHSLSDGFREQVAHFIDTLVAKGQRIADLERERDEARAEVERLERLVYVPGLWKCAKCDFRLVQANLNAHDGSVTSRDEPGDKCPNCSSPLWRVTERGSGNYMVDRCEEQVQRAVHAETALAAERAAREKAEAALDEARRFIAGTDDGDRFNTLARIDAALSPDEAGREGNDD